MPAPTDATDAFLADLNVTPFQLASLAVQFALLRGGQDVQNQDLDKAKGLVIQAAVHLPIRDHEHYQRLVDALKALHETSPRDLQHAARAFPGADQITPPRKFPAPLESALAAITGRRERKRNAEILAQLRKALPDLRFPKRFDYDVEFWDLAQRVAPFCPRFRKLYTQAPVKRPRSRQEGAKGQFTKARRNDWTGRFRPQPKR